jgi:hypothetical protein
MWSTYLCVIDLAGAEQSVQRVVAGNDESGNVDEELASNVEEDEEEVETGKTENGVDLGHGGLLLEVVEGGVLGQLEHAGASVQHTARKECCTVEYVAGMHISTWQLVHVQIRHAYLFVELRQRLLGALLGRHGEFGEELNAME